MMWKDERSKFINNLRQLLSERDIASDFDYAIFKISMCKDYIKVRNGGKRVIDISKVNNNFTEPDKADAIVNFIEQDEMTNTIFFGNEMQKGGRDSSIKRNRQTTNIITIGVEDSKNAEDGVILLSDFEQYRRLKENTQRMLSFLDELVMHSYAYFNYDTEARIYLTLSDFFNRLGIENRFKFGKNFTLCFDVDDTLLGHKKDDDNLRENFNDDQLALRNVIVELWKIRFNIVFLSDNSCENIIKRVAIPIVAQVINENLDLPPLNIISSGMTVNVRMHADGNIDVNKNFSEQYGISSQGVEKLMQVLGQVVEDKDGELTRSGLIGEYYTRITDNTNNPAYPKKDGFLARNYPKFKITGAITSTKGNLCSPKIEKRYVPTTNTVVQLAVGTIVSNHFMNDI